MISPDLAPPTGSGTEVQPPVLLIVVEVCPDSEALSMCIYTNTHINVELEMAFWKETEQVVIVLWISWTYRHHVLWSFPF